VFDFRHQEHQRIPLLSSKLYIKHFAKKNQQNELCWFWRIAYATK